MVQVISVGHQVRIKHPNACQNTTQNKQTDKENRIVSLKKESVLMMLRTKIVWDFHENKAQCFQTLR